MTTPVLVLLGDFTDQREVFDRAAAEFGWVTAMAQTKDDFTDLCDRTEVVGVLLNTQDCGAGEGCQPVCRARSRGNQVRPILCWHAAERLDNQDFQRLGAYDALLMPPRLSEVRLTLGFLAQAITQEMGHSTRGISHPVRPRASLEDRISA
jgi:hypothetical protein